MTEAAAHPHIAARKTLVEVNGVLQASPAPRFSRSISTEINTPRAVGGDTADLRKELNEAPKAE